MKRTIGIISTLAFLLALGTASASELQTTAGTMELGGTAGFNVNMQIPSEGDSETGFSLSIYPSVGYFIVDNLELLGGLGMWIGFGDLYENSSKLIGFNLGARYLIDVASFNLYFGATIGMDFTIPDEGDTRKALDINAPIGLLIPFNSHVALDLGIRVTYRHDLEDPGISSFLLPIGYFGIDGFF